jgi:hypothetical protein
MNGSRTVLLVGDARAFLYAVPMSRLRYRTVFDVPSEPPDLETAWLRSLDETESRMDPTLKSVGKDPIVIFNRSELDRLAKTYRR